MKHRIKRNINSQKNKKSYKTTLNNIKTRKRTRKVIKKKGGKKIKNNTHTRKFKKLQCAPRVNNKKDGNHDNDELQEYSCYTKDDLIKMKNLWNARHKDSVITDTTPKIFGIV